jgi:radical SAM superfamily enzyme YgiQ (UPF0313 family)
MVNGAFVFGMDEDDETVFERTVEWAVQQGIETATFHILTPYPGTALHDRLSAEGRIFSSDWDRYDTRHAVFRPRRMSAEALEAGYHRAYRDFYSWRSIARGAWVRDGAGEKLRHFAYATGWKKLEPLWDLAVRSGQVSRFLPLLEMVLNGSAERDALRCHSGRPADVRLRQRERGGLLPPASRCCDAACRVRDV